MHDASYHIAVQLEGPEASIYLNSWEILLIKFFLSWCYLASNFSGLTLVDIKHATGAFSFISFQGSLRLYSHRILLWELHGIVFHFWVKQKNSTFSRGCNHNCFCLLQLYHVEPPVSQVIAPVIYMWRPSQLPKRIDEEKAADCVGNDFRKLWVWIHASSFSEGCASLKLACQNQVSYILFFPFWSHF